MRGARRMCHEIYAILAIDAHIPPQQARELSISQIKVIFDVLEKRDRERQRRA